MNNYLAETTAANDSGAYLVGTFDEFDNSNSANVQDVLDDLDATLTTSLSNTGYFDQTNGLYPKNSTVDFLIGGQATSSAKFAILNINSGTPTAYFWELELLFSLPTDIYQPQPDKLYTWQLNFHDTTGNILLNPNGTGNVGIGDTTPASMFTVGSGIFSNQ